MEIHFSFAFDSIKGLSPKLSYVTVKRIEGKNQEKKNFEHVPGSGKNRMAKVTMRAWTHPQDDQILPGSWVMAELHARPRPVGLFIKILGEHHYSTRNKLQNVTCR